MSRRCGFLKLGRGRFNQKFMMMRNVYDGCIIGCIMVYHGV